MPKVLCIAGMVISVLLLVLFGMDLAMGVPFQGRSTMMDVVFIICAAILGFLGWMTFREQI